MYSPEYILNQTPVLECLFRTCDFSTIIALCKLNKRLRRKCMEPLYWEHVIAHFLKLQDDDSKRLNVNINPLKLLIDRAFKAKSPIAEVFIIAFINLNSGVLANFFFRAVEQNYPNLTFYLIKKGIEDVMVWEGLMYLNGVDGPTYINLKISNGLKNYV